MAAARALGQEVLETRLPADCAATETESDTGGWSAADLPDDVAAEVAKLLRADRIVLHFPLWWFAPPAAVKGWCDRALAHGPIHDSRHRFDTGRLAGKTVLFCVTTGASAAESGPDGREGDTRLLLWPLAQTFRYCGATVLEPRIVHGVHRFHSGAAARTLSDRLSGVLAAQRRIMEQWPDLPVWPMNTDADFDAEGRLRPDALSHSPFIRRR